MDSTTNIGEVTKALKEFQDKQLVIIKNTDGYQYKYVRLDTLLEQIFGTLREVGLSIHQFPKNEGNLCGCVTIVEHGESQQRICFDTLLPLSKDDCQAAGSCISYARRYAIQTLLGIAPEDDDGAAASDKSNEAQLACYTGLRAAAHKKNTEFLYFLRQAFSEATFVDSFNAAPKKSKQKFKDAVRDLESLAQKQANDYETQIRECLDGADTAGIAQLMDELQETVFTKTVVMDRFTDEEKQMIAKSTGGK